MLPEIRKNGAECCDIFCEEGVFSIEQSRRLLTAAKDLGYRLRFMDQIVLLQGDVLLPNSMLFRPTILLY